MKSKFAAASTPGHGTGNVGPDTNKQAVLTDLERKLQRALVCLRMTT
jgi:hypothetical protein